MAESLSYFALGAVGNMLTLYFQRLWSHAKHQPSAFGVEKSACCVHGILQLTCCLLQLQRPAFTV